MKLSQHFDFAASYHSLRTQPELVSCITMTRAQQIGVIVGLAIVAALTVLRAFDPLPLRVAREITFDEYQRLLPRRSTEICLCA